MHIRHDTKPFTLRSHEIYATIIESVSTNYIIDIIQWSRCYQNISTLHQWLEVLMTQGDLQYVVPTHPLSTWGQNWHNRWVVTTTTHGSLQNAAPRHCSRIWGRILNVSLIYHNENEWRSIERCTGETTPEMEAKLSILTTRHDDDA